MSGSFVSIGLGAMGVGAARALLDRGWVCRGAVSHQVGLSLSEILDCGMPGMSGVVVSEHSESILDLGADLCVIATRSKVADIYDDVVHAVGAGMNVLSSSEELVYPWASAPGLAVELDHLASDAGVSVLGAGINPGYVLDVLPVLLTAACRSVRMVEAIRVNDLSPFGPSVLRSFGVGLSLEEFESAWDAGLIAGHVGFPQSITMISDALRLGVNRVEETVTPIVAAEERRGLHGVVAPGGIAGVRQEGVGYADGNPVVRLIHPQQVAPHAGGVDTVDAITISGDPDIEVCIRPEIPGGTGTVAMMVNAAGPLVAAPPGLLSPLELPVFRAGAGGMKGPIRCGRVTPQMPPIKYLPQAASSLQE